MYFKFKCFSKIPWKSFRFRVVTVTFAAVAILLGILIFNNIYAVSIVHKQVFESNYRVLSLFMSNVDHAFQDVEKFFVGLQASNSLISVTYTEDDKAFYTAQARLVKELEAAAPSYSYVEDLFVYAQKRDQYMDATGGYLDGEERSAIKSMALELIDAESYAGGKWSWYWIGEEPYLVRILKMRDTYMGACVKVSTLVEKLRQDGFGEMEYLSFTSLWGEELGSRLPALAETIRLEKDQSYYRMVGGRNQYMMLSIISDCGDYGLVALIRDNNILEGLKSFQILIWMLAAVLTVFLSGLTLLMRRWVIWPLSELIRAMRCLSQGQFDIRLREQVDCEEFSVVNETFDDMAKEIQTLKIGVYEEKVQRQRAELQYMKLQVNPHFYINCLNVIHNLSLVKKNDLILQMTAYLGNHLRYTMEGSALDTIERELACVENYLKIQELRFPESIACTMEVEENVRQVLAPPLLIQTFVENTVKYQVTSGELTHICISVKRSGQEPRNLLIEILDDGEGYPERVLDCLQNDRRIFDERGEHYGIRNVRQRLALIYHESAKMEIGNHPETGGAWVRICLPDDIRPDSVS